MIHVGPGRVYARVKVGVRHVEYQIAPHLYLSPPFGEYGICTSEIFEGVRGKDVIEEVVRENTERIVGRQVKLDVDTLSPSKVDAYGFGAYLLLAAAEVETDTVNVTYDPMPALRDFRTTFFVSC